MSAADASMSLLLDEFLPTYDVDSEHHTHANAPVEPTYEAARRLDLSGSWVVRTLFRLRGMPASALDAAGLERIRFKPLRVDPPRYTVLGIVGQFWKPAGRLLDFDPAHFTTLEAPGYARAVWAFEVSAASGGSHLRTATRVACPDAETRRRFLTYWRVIGPFSGLIRREALKTVKRTAEASAASQTEVGDG